jgi:pimeloyl-ACP methyl ester carboxylesterase
MSTTVDVDGPMHVERLGSGPPLVLVHGLGSSHVHWMAVAPALARNYSVHIPDLPGFGLTPSEGRSPELVPSSRLLAAYLGRFRGRAVVIGNSMGALLALLVAARERPAAVGRLVLVSPPGPRPLRTPVERDLFLLFSAYAWPGLGELTRDLWVRLKGPDGLARNLLEVCCSNADAVPPEVVEAARRLARGRPHQDEVHAFLAAYRSTWTYLLNGSRFDALLRAVQVPVLVIHGERDRLVPAIVSDRLARVRPDWTHVTFPGSGHMPQLDSPEQFVASVTEWLAEADRPQAAG